MSGLVVSDVTVYHGAIRALDGVSFTIPRGSLTAVIGANGAGKTTLLRTISGLVAPESGSVTWDGETLFGRKAEDIVRAGVVHVSEGKAVIPELTVEENLALGGLWQRDKSRVKQAHNDVFELFPRLAERKSQYAATLSGGERQMLAIGRAFITRPSLLLLDEPSLGLAPLVIEQIFRTIKILQEQYGLTILLVEQNAMGALAIADQGVAMNLGRVVASMASEQLRENPALRAAYLGF